MVLYQGKIQVSKRGWETLSKQAIDSLEKGLIELITNSDDSYASLEGKGKTASGKIEIEIERHGRSRGTPIRVIDCAAGMDATEMRQCVAEYGENTSPEGGRGVFGMGLKDTLIAFGYGKVTSFKHDKKWTCEVFGDGEYKIHEPQKITASDVRDFPSHAGGTTVDVLIEKGRFRISQFDKLRQDLQTHVCLRQIMTDSKRTVILRNGKTGEEQPPLVYREPDGELIYEGELEISGYPGAKALLKVYRAKGAEVLTQSEAGFCRTGGIVIKSFRACHEATLFGFDEDPHAAKLFGELRCDEIYVLQRSGEQVVTKERNGLSRQHPFSQALIKAAKKVIENIVAEERKKAEQAQKTIESEETRKRFKEAVKALNKIAHDELEDFSGSSTGEDVVIPPHEPRVPQNGFEFVPDSYRVVVAEKDHLKLRILLDAESGINIGDTITVESNSEGVTVLKPKINVPPERYENPPIAITQVELEGIQPNAEAIITARCNGKEALALVEVVSSRQQREARSGGLFKDIKYKRDPDSPQRAYFDRRTGIISINTQAPSVSLYMDADGNGHDSAPSQCLVAELVTQIVCEEIARWRRERGKLEMPVGVKELDAYYNYLNKLRTLHAATIHKLLVNSKFRR